VPVEIQTREHVKLAPLDVEDHEINRADLCRVEYRAESSCRQQ
jgi:hypothetical protein